MTALRPLALVAAAVVLAACAAPPPPPAAPDPRRAPASQDERMAWWRDARFGLFLHWGLYAIPAGKWRDHDGYGEWIRDSARIPREVYAEYQPNWNPTGFDADAWARMAKAAGMKYVVITSKHHDGFCLWDSEHTDWDVGRTPHGRDVLAELAAACRKHGLAFGTYHSIMDWHHPDYLPRRPWETDRPATGAEFSRYERYLHAQVAELVQRYQPAILWFDGEWESTWNHERGVRLFAHCRELAPAMLVNNRVDVHRGGMAGFSTAADAVGDFATPEQEIPATGLPGVDWESCMTMNAHWGWNAADRDWKSTKDLLRNLIDVASKGGNYLLNVGPRADGTFPPEAVERLAQVGAWMASNGEAIHGTTASPFDALPWGRCTTKRAGDRTTLFLHVFDWPKDGVLRVPGLGSAPRRAWLVGDPVQRLRATASDDGVAIAVPAAALDAIATVVALEVDGTPLVFRAPTITAESSSFVRTLAVDVAAADPRVEVRCTTDGRDPVAGDPVVRGALRITDSCTVKAATFWQGKRRGPVAARAFTQATPLPPVKALATREGLIVERHAVDWRSIPDDRGGLPVTARDAVASVGPLREPGERVALVYRGFLLAPRDDVYRFALASDDGSKLWLDGQVVVDHDGLHGPTEKRGEIALAAGLHAIEVVWFNASGGASLELQWAAPGGPFAPLDAGCLRH
ncbi:MAG: alpha-L-fucosidase [Planctomycetota bacterium]